MVQGLSNLPLPCLRPQRRLQYQGAMCTRLSANDGISGLEIPYIKTGEVLHAHALMAGTKQVHLVKGSAVHGRAGRKAVHAGVAAIPWCSEGTKCM
jgi:hypothetical protein